MCNLFLNMCIVGLTQVGPAEVKVELMDDRREIHEFVCQYQGEWQRDVTKFW